MRPERELTRKTYPTVTIIVPCWNEEQTVEGTVFSLLTLDYPTDKLSIFLVNDGSKDNTWNIMQQFKGHNQISIFNKENGGKHTAVNLGIKHATSEFVVPRSIPTIIKSHSDENHRSAG